MRVVWLYGDGPCWDQGLVWRLVRGELWPGTLPNAPAYTAQDPRLVQQHHSWVGSEGAVIVMHGEVTSRDGYADALERLVAALPWAVVIHTSDERLTYDSGRLRGPRCKTWLQMSAPDGRVHHDRPLLLGWRAETPELAAALPVGALERRPLAAAFAGQRQNQFRRDAVKALYRLRDEGHPVDVLVTGGFGQGRPLPEHLAALASARVAVCPSGNTVDCQRPYEALEVGALPVADRRGPGWAEESGGYWRQVLGREPFPCLDDWRELPLWARDTGPVELQRAATAAGAWWHGHKRELAYGLADDVRSLGGPEAPRHPVTVLMPTSSTPGHPATDGIEASIRRTRAYPEMRDAEVLILVDGLHPNHAHRAAAYEEYKRRLLELCKLHPDFRGCLPVVFDEHAHQSGMLRAALDLVRTPLVFWQEHDTFPLWDIDWDGLFHALRTQPHVNQVQLHTDDGIRDEHRYLMVGGVQRVAGVPMIRHRKFSARPQLCRTEWLRGVVAEYFGAGARTMIEDVLFGALATRVGQGVEPWERWGTWIYAPDDPAHGILRSHTNDQRAGEAKVPLVVEYPGPTPVGAPRPGTHEW